MSEALSLLEELATVPDPRSRKGRLHPLRAILSLTVVATLAGCKSLDAIAKFGRDRGTALAHALGFTRGKTPNKSCLSKLFRRLDVAALEEALGRWILGRLQHHGWDAIALDGEKKQCNIRSSNAGQCLFTGIAEPNAAAKIKDDLLGEQFFSGWGIRTIPTSEVRYNPMSYHNGSI